MRPTSPARLAGTLIAVLLLTIACGSAFAYFTSGGLGTASAAVAQLTTPTITAATANAGGTVSLTWSAATAPGEEAVRYYVTRDGGNPAGTCAAPAVPTAATSCTDSGLSIAKHTYTVTAVWRSWSQTSASASATVTVGEATKFTISAATTTPAVSVADNLTITAKDVNGATVTTYAGSHNLVFSGASSSPSGSAPTVANGSGTAIAFGSATALTFTAGVAAVTTTKNGVLKIYKAAAASIAATEGTITTPTPLALTVSPGAATKYTLALQTATPAVAATDDLTITAQDAYGNTATAYTGSHNLVFSGPAASPSPSSKAATVSDSAGNAVPIGSATPIVFSAGVATPSGTNNGELVVYKSGATTIKATEGTITHTAVALTVAAGTANKLILTAATTTPVAAAADNLTLTARDAYENTATAYTGAKNIVFSGAETSPSGAAPTVANSSGTAIAFGTNTALTFSSGVATVSTTKNGVLKLNKAGAANVSASDGTITTAAPLAFTVSVGSAARLGLTSVTASAGSIGSPCLFTCTITLLGNGGTVTANVSVTDSVGNTVSELGSGHTAKVTATAGGTVTGGAELTFPATGAAVSPTQFTYTAPASDAFTHTITAATLAGTVYTSATATASK
jgi:hypothetical protein